MRSIKLFINDRFRNRQVEFFNEFDFTMVYNSIASTFSFKFYYNYENFELKELTCVSHFHEVTIFHNDELLLTGTALQQGFNSGPFKSLTELTGYTKTGVLEDCNIPPSVYPLQSDGLSLKRIANKLISPFNSKNNKLELIVDKVVESDASKALRTSTANATDTIKSYLASLAAQKNIILSHDEKGRLLLTRADTDKDPIMEVDTTKPLMNAIGVDFLYDGQQMHSHITVMKQASVDDSDASEYTIRNPYVVGSVYRPKVVTQNSGDNLDTKLVARRELSNELRGMPLTITIPDWDIDNNLVRPGEIVSVFSPENYIFVKQNFFVESVNYKGSSEGTTATLNCVLPEVYNDKKVVSMFHGINIHAPDE